MAQNELLPQSVCAAPGCGAPLLSERQIRPVKSSGDAAPYTGNAKSTVAVRVCVNGHEQRDYYS